MLISKVILCVKKFALLSLLICLLALLVIQEGKTYDIDKLHVTAQGLDIKKYLGLYDMEYRNLSGNGVTIAIIDSGVQQHNDLSGSRIIKFVDFVNKKIESYDDNGHGTFIAGIIGANGKLVGIAPNSKFVVLKALDREGKTTYERLEESLEWIINNQIKYGIKIVNLSLGIDNFHPNNNDSLYKLFYKMKQMGVLVICSAGNSGPEKNTIVYPAESSDVITVGSVNNKMTYDYEDDTIMYTSSRGDSSGARSYLCKPDIVTFGADIFSLSYKDKGSYETLSGTSFSTAIVSGLSAVLMEKYPDMNNLFIENLLRSSTIPLKSQNCFEQGRGSIKM
ncbi:S8 family serine peptidase [Paenibacillus doosanensis]|uniref:S8 family serine peptidase n=1 Tax=Paenibacillus doosanensis TaxID=1229154 RepID=UPI00217FD868|nr:S8 family serine peptidase [Paenibacillus doosanensis]MCS7464177.1 S8 family serine peptidase [Paenibacillus doosanensis]